MLKKEFKFQKSFKDIFFYIVNKGETTRREIEKDLGYSWATVSSNVSKLMDDGYIIESEALSQSRGRSTYKIKPTNKIVTIGVDINSVGLSYTVAGLDGSEIICYLIPFTSKTQEQFIDQIFDTFDRAFAWVGDKYKVFSIGLSLQGGVDSKEGVFIEFPFIKEWKEVNIKKMLEDRYGYFTYINNDMVCLTKDLLLKKPEFVEDGLLIRLVDGIGFGFTSMTDELNEKICANFGHIIVETNGEECICGKRGCLEAYSSIVGILKRANLGEDKKDYLLSHHDEFRKYFDDAAYYLGIIITDLCSSFALKHIVLTGNLCKNDPIFIEKVQESYNNNKGIYEKPHKIHYYDNVSASRGAALLSAEKKILNIQKVS